MIIKGFLPNRSADLFGNRPLELLHYSGYGRGELCSPANVTLSDIGIIVDKEIQKLNTVYDAVRVDKYCIMPDHIYMILTIDSDENRQTQFCYSKMYKRMRRGDLCRPLKQCGYPINQAINHAG